MPATDRKLLISLLENPDIDIILMDIQLPVMDGYTTARKIREFREDIIIIAQTAYGLMDEKEKIMESGFDDYLIKPIISKVLIEKIKIKSCKEKMNLTFT